MGMGGVGAELPDFTMGSDATAIGFAANDVMLTSVVTVRLFPALLQRILLLLLAVLLLLPVLLVLLLLLLIITIAAE